MSDDRRRPQAWFSEVRLRNFKSVVEQSVPLAPLTTIVGPNSSGKSSLLQALAAFAQAMRAGNESDTVPLNGPLVNLGRITDILNANAPVGSSVSVGVSVRTASLEARRPVPSGAARHVGASLDDWTIEYDLAFGGAAPKDPVASVIQSVDLAVDRPGADRVVNLYLRRTRSPKPILSWYDVYFDWNAPSPGDFHQSLQGKLEGPNGVANIVGASVKSSLPFDLLSRSSRRRVLTEAWAQFISTPHLYGRRLLGSKPSTNDDRPPMDYLATAGTEALVLWEEANQPPANLISFFMQQADLFEGLAAATQRIAQSDYRKVIRRIDRSQLGLGQVPTRVEDDGAKMVREAGRAIRQQCEMLRHLGGLRAAPQPLYPSSSVAQQGDIGTAGQFTAAVLYAIRDRLVHGFTPEGEQIRTELSKVVEIWAREFGLFHSVEPHHQGPLGVDISVQQAGVDRQLDVTQVGIGVSQLLPVIVLCLVSPPGSVILLEQPELHLHPASQQSLADFLLACTSSGRQIIVETHSEHLVNRLRRRIAEDDSGLVDDAIGIIFAERDPISGETAYEKVEVNAAGGIENWPSGFYSEGIEDAKQTLAAGLRKLGSAVAD